MTPEMDDMFARAERDGLWFFCCYQQLWFSPQQLRAHQANGKFRWGAVNWELRNPEERVTQAERELADAQRRLDEVRKQVRRT